MNPLPQPIPFYRSQEGQLFRKHYLQSKAYDANLVMYTSGGLQLPRLDILIPMGDGGAVQSLGLYDAETDALALALATSGWTTEALGGDDAPYDSVTRPNGTLSATTSGLSDGGRYYLKAGLFSDSGTVYYWSEAITLILVGAGSFGPECEHLTRLRWSTDCIIGERYFNAGEFFMYLQADPGRPTWPLQEEEERNAVGESTPLFQRVEKSYEIEAYGPESVGDALSHTVLFSNVMLEFSDGTVWPIRPGAMEVEWDEDGALGTFTLKFTRMDGITKQGCC